MKSYHDQKNEPEVIAAIEDFQKEGNRFSKFIKHLDKCLAANKARSAFFVGEAISYVDFACFEVMSSAKNQFPEAFERDASADLKGRQMRPRRCGGPCSSVWHYSFLCGAFVRPCPFPSAEFVSTMAARPRLAAYLASDRRKGFAGDSMV